MLLEWMVGTCCMCAGKIKLMDEAVESIGRCPWLDHAVSIFLAVTGLDLSIYFSRKHGKTSWETVIGLVGANAFICQCCLWW
jgi:hypothetical protein